MNSEAKIPISASDVVVALLGYFARLFILVVLLAVCSLYIKTHMAYWSENAMKLPTVTERLVWFCLYMRKEGWWQLLPLVALFDLAVTLVLVLRFHQHRWMSIAYSQVLLCAAIAFLFWAFLCASLPLSERLLEPT